MNRCKGCGRGQSGYDLNIGWCACGVPNGGATNQDQSYRDYYGLSSHSNPHEISFGELTNKLTLKEKLNIAENFLVKLQRECECDITCRKCHEINDVLRKLAPII